MSDNDYNQDGKKNRSDDYYDPNQAYNYEQAHTDPEIGPNGHPVPPSRRKPNNLAAAGLAASIATFFLCCCSPYAGIISSILGLTLAICSKYFNNDERRLSGCAIAAIIISSIALILILGSILISYVLVPYLMDTSPAFKEYYNSMYETMQQLLEEQLQ